MNKTSQEFEPAHLQTYKIVIKTYPFGYGDLLLEIVWRYIFKKYSDYEKFATILGVSAIPMLKPHSDTAKRPMIYAQEKMKWQYH